MLMRVKVDQNEKELLKASGNYIKESDCFEVEIIKNDLPCDTTYRIELMDNDYLNVTKQELRVLKALLNDHRVSYLLELDKMEEVQ